MRQFNKMFQVGKNNGHENRVTAATTSTNTPAPPMYGLRKDHKQTINEEEGPPVRPVCGAREAPNARLSNFLLRVINDYCNVAEIDSECRSGEEMKAAFEHFNEEDSDESGMDLKILRNSGVSSGKKVVKSLNLKKVKIESNKNEKNSGK